MHFSAKTIYLFLVFLLHVALNFSNSTKISISAVQHVQQSNYYVELIPLPLTSPKISLEKCFECYCGEGSAKNEN